MNNAIGKFLNRLRSGLFSVDCDDNTEIEMGVVEIDGVEFHEVYDLTIDDITYIFLRDPEDPERFAIQRLVEEDGVKYACGLDSNDEFNEVLVRFASEVISTF